MGERDLCVAGGCPLQFRMRCVSTHGEIIGSGVTEIVEHQGMPRLMGHNVRQIKGPARAASDLLTFASLLQAVGSTVRKTEPSNWPSVYEIDVKSYDLLAGG